VPLYPWVQLPIGTGPIPDEPRLRNQHTARSAVGTCRRGRPIVPGAAPVAGHSVRSGISPSHSEAKIEIEFVYKGTASGVEAYHVHLRLEPSGLQQLTHTGGDDAVKFAGVRGHFTLRRLGPVGRATVAVAIGALLPRVTLMSVPACVQPDHTVVPSHRQRPADTVLWILVTLVTGR
jgi:hypothetical protein